MTFDDLGNKLYIDSFQRGKGETMKKFLISFLVISLVASTVTFAGNLAKKVYFSPFPIRIDNEEYASEMPILQYQDRTYVALREFSEMVGVKIDFIDNEIIIETKEAKEKKEERETKDAEETKEKNVENQLVEYEQKEIINDEKNGIIAQNTENNSNSEIQGRIVYVSKSGKKYHNLSNCNSAEYTAISISEALNRGYTPCLRCANSR